MMKEENSKQHKREKNKKKEIIKKNDVPIVRILKAENHASGNGNSQDEKDGELVGK